MNHSKKVDPVQQMRARHDDFIDAQAKRLGVEPADILRSVVDFGLTSDHIAKLTDKSGLTCYANGHGLKILEVRPVRRVMRMNAARNEFRAHESKAKPKAKPKRAKVAVKRQHRLTGDGSMAQALRAVGFLQKP